MLKRIFKKTNAMIAIWLWCCALCASMSISESELMAEELNDDQLDCPVVPLIVMRRFYGPLYDYQDPSISQPLDEIEANLYYGNDRDQYLVKRKIEEHPSIFENENDLLVSYPISDKIAWEENWDETSVPNSNKNRRKRDLLPMNAQRSAFATTIDDENTRDELLRQKRQSKEFVEPWHCEQKVKWVDMGADYFPRLLRTVECTKPKCYYDHYDCKPKPHAIHVLQRRRGSCGNASRLKMYGFTGDKAEAWQWAKVKVNFCCECRRTRRYF